MARTGCGRDHHGVGVATSAAGGHTRVLPTMGRGLGIVSGARIHRNSLVNTPLIITTYVNAGAYTITLPVRGQSRAALEHRRRRRGSTQGVALRWIRLVIAAGLARVRLVLHEQGSLWHSRPAIEKGLERRCRRVAVDIQQLAATVPRAGVDPCAVRALIVAARLQHCAVHGRQQPLAVRVDETLVKTAPSSSHVRESQYSLCCWKNNWKSGKAGKFASVFPNRCLVGLMLVRIIKRLLRKQSGLDLICKDCTGQYKRISADWYQPAHSHRESKSHTHILERGTGSRR